MSGYYNKEGKEIDLYEWARLLEDIDYKIIKQETLKNGYFVSTVWLGLNHAWREGEVLIFETMVFDRKDDKNSYMDVYMDRYTTEAEARRGHEIIKDKFDYPRWVLKLRSWLGL